ncbi:hypothetical protein J3R82DRAFT_11046 [Butyriboletus roseoflavus]|nr:hypothetical protein J3R82DRAFT_11046 [Butyriboletus roseoflavus]
MRCTHLFLFVGILGIFKAYLTLADPGLFLSMLVLSPEIYPYLPRTYARSVSTEGNANFYYAASLVMGVASGMSVVDACLAGLRIAFGDIAEGERVKWAIVQEYIDL